MKVQKLKIYSHSSPQPHPPLSEEIEERCVCKTLRIAMGSNKAIKF